jgi:hypothetical protein
MNELTLSLAVIVIWEVLGTWLWLLLALLAIWIGLVGWAWVVRRQHGRGVARAWPWSLLFGGFVAIVAVFALPWLTHSSLAYVAGIDFLFLAIAALGAGVAAMLFAWPILFLARARR